MTRRAAIGFAAAMMLNLIALAKSAMRPVLPPPEGLYTDGESCSAAVIGRNLLFTGLSVWDVIGDSCELRSVTRGPDIIPVPSGVLGRKRQR